MLEPGTRYDMPANYGPSVAPGVEGPYVLHGVTVPYETDPGKLAPLLPPSVEPTERPMVSVSYQRCSNMAWMGGRAYNLVSIYVSAMYRGKGVELEAPLSMAIWESDCAPIIAGREYLGTPKLFGQIEDVDVTRESFEFSCVEYGSTLLTGSVTGMREVSPEQFARIAESGREIVRMHWKYIPGPQGTVDADYMVAMYAASEYEKVWKGSGEIRFGAPSALEAPYSSRIVAALSALPVVKYRPATSVYAPRVWLYRDRTRRLSGNTPVRCEPVAAPGAAR